MGGAFAYTVRQLANTQRGNPHWYLRRNESPTNASAIQSVALRWAMLGTKEVNRVTDRLGFNAGLLK
jgi:hypothetical protein